MAAASAARSTARRRAWRRDLEGYLFISPVVLGLLIWTLGPVLTAFYLSLTKYDLLTAPIFRGLRNYQRLLSDALFVQSLKVTLTFTVIMLPLGIALGLALALLLNQKLKGVALFRTAFYLPAVAPPVATALLWAWLFGPRFGFLNEALTWLHLPTGTWLTEPNTALPSLMIMGLWGVGGGMVIYLAGLQGVPEDYYEAAKIDGAGPISQFRNVTLPMISPTLFFQLVLGLIGTAGYFTQAYVLTSGSGVSAALGSPQNSTLFLTLEIYQVAFDWTQMGYACAMAIVMFALVLLLTLIVFATAPLWVYYAGGDR